MLSFAEIILLALALAIDAFTVALGAAASGCASGPRATFRISFHFGLFQFLMPVIGWLLGIEIVHYIAGLDHWVAFGLLGFVGSKMILSGLQQGLKSFKTDPSRGLTLIILCIATSIDALAVGLSLAVLKVNIWYPSVIIGLVTGFMALIGMWAGDLLGRRFGKSMEIIGGIILIIIGARILVSHLEIAS